MFTYVLYNIIIVSTTLSAYLYEKSQNKNLKTIFLFFSFMIPYFFLAVRYDVGNDYHNYVDYFHWIADGAIVLKEPGYVLLNYLLAKYDLSVQWLFVIFGFFTMLFTYRGLPKDGFALSIFLFLVIYYFLWVFTSLRETLVISMMFYASKYIYEKRFLPYLVWAIVGMQFHIMMALLLLLIYPIANKNINKYLLMGAIVATFAVVVFTDLAHSIIVFIVSIFPKYSWYLNSEYMQPAKSSSGLLGPIIKIAISLMIIYFKDTIVHKYPKANMAINLYTLSAIGGILLLDISIFSRLEAAYMLYFILSVVYFSKTFDRKSRILIIFIVSLFYYAIFMRYLGIATADRENGLYLRPYRTIFYKQTTEPVFLQ